MNQRLQWEMRREREREEKGSGEGTSHTEDYGEKVKGRTRTG